MTIRKIIILTAMLAFALPALAQSGRRAGHGEIYIGPVFSDGKSYNFEGGSTATTSTGYGWNLGFGYNFDQHWNAGIEFNWSEQDYRANVQPGIGNGFGNSTISGTLESSTVRFFGTYNLLQGNFTPFVTGGMGWTYIDTNIPSGLPENVCWYYPWYGSYCASYVPTQSTTKFSYSGGLGLRLDAGQGVFKFLVQSHWVDFGGSYGSSNVLQYRIDIGTKF